MEFAYRRLFLWVLLLFPASLAFAAPDSKVWALRDHMTFTGGHAYIDYDCENSAWRVRLDDQRVVADELSFRILLEDGAVLTSRDLGKAELIREKFNHPDFGPGSHFVSIYKPYKGLQVNYKVSQLDTRPFFVVQMTLKNVGTVPIAVTEIIPVSTAVGYLGNMSPTVEVRSRWLTSRGGIPVYAKDAPPMGMLFRDPDKNFILAIGLLPEGKALSTVNLQPSGDRWHGDIASRFTPAALLAPGAALDSDPLGVSIGLPEASRVDKFYSWAFSTLAEQADGKNAPRSWVSVTENEGLDQLLQTATAWKSAGIEHAVVPAGWDAPPGSQEGASPRWPRNIGQAASAIGALGLKAGLTIDPLAADGSVKSGGAQGPDGQWWANPAVPGGREHLKKQAQQLLGKGFAFLLASPSRIPDAVLRQFGIPRGEAETLAFTALVEGAGGRPVLPAAESTLPLNRDAWLEAAGSVCRIAYYGAPIGPVRLQTAGASSIEAETLAALRLWPGPIEVLGTARRSAVDDLGNVFRAARAACVPLDASQPCPKVWHATNATPDAIITFAGAGKWDQAELEREAGAATPPVLTAQNDMAKLMIPGGTRARAAAGEAETQDEKQPGSASKAKKPGLRNKKKKG
jgi:hypothetical protein